MDLNNACNEEMSSSMTREFEPLRFGDGASQSMQVVTNRNWIYNRDDGEMGGTPLRHSEFSVSNHLYNLKTQSVVSGEEITWISSGSISRWMHKVLHLRAGEGLTWVPLGSKETAIRAK